MFSNPIKKKVCFPIPVIIRFINAYHHHFVRYSIDSFASTASVSYNCTDDLEQISL